MFFLVIRRRRRLQRNPTNILQDRERLGEVGLTERYQLLCQLLNMFLTKQHLNVREGWDGDGSLPGCIEWDWDSFHTMGSPKTLFVQVFIKVHSRGSITLREIVHPMKRKRLEELHESHWRWSCYVDDALTAEQQT